MQVNENGRLMNQSIGSKVYIQLLGSMPFDPNPQFPIRSQLTVKYFPLFWPTNKNEESTQLENESSKNPLFIIIINEDLTFQEIISQQSLVLLCFATSSKV